MDDNSNDYRIRMLKVLEKFTIVIFTYYSFKFFDATFDWLWPVSLLVGFVTGWAATMIAFVLLGVVLGLLAQAGILDKDKLNALFSVNQVKQEKSIVDSKDKQITYSEKIIGTFMDSPIYEWVHFEDINNKFRFETVIHKDKDGLYQFPTNLPEYFIILEPGVTYVPDKKIDELA